MPNWPPIFPRPLTRLVTPLPCPLPLESPIYSNSDKLKSKNDIVVTWRGARRDAIVGQDSSALLRCFAFRNQQIFPMHDCSESQEMTFPIWCITFSLWFCVWEIPRTMHGEAASYHAVCLLVVWYLHGDAASYYAVCLLVLWYFHHSMVMLPAIMLSVC